MRELAKKLWDADDEIRAGIQAVEDRLKELKLGIRLEVKVPGQGLLFYGKQDNNWKIWCDNSEFSHQEKCQPLVSCTREVRSKAAQLLPVLLQQAANTIIKELQERSKAKEALRVALEALKDANTQGSHIKTCSMPLDFGAVVNYCDKPKHHEGKCKVNGVVGKPHYDETEEE